MERLIVVLGTVLMCLTVFGCGRSDPTPSQKHLSTRITAEDLRRMRPEELSSFHVQRALHKQRREDARRREQSEETDW